MIGTKQWISKVEVTIEGKRKRNVDTINVEYFKQLLQQGKKISQIISYIWFDEDHDTAKKLDGYFKRGKNDDLKKLLFAQAPETDEYKLLLKVFKEEKYLPIFDKDDEQFFMFRVVTDQFEGNISDPGPSDNGILTVTIPYPPRPEIFDDFDEYSNTVIPQNGFTTIKQSELKEWLNQAPDEPPYFYENNPYIPATSS
ncbi:hypothetical protein COO91_08367 [Nostoc flagelliforme CCNUN1]|uniref:Uncharacterized protein n=1 Tax=Nostoc flagelliforme CCNUN1 TaxID=2038116 RepID=A0A2K8T5F0_9NOSO|nr:hypothetical protein [Nostoc flagelliforme]AUB42255.1 hypothetical protein COO91_08367 [Nostoc flagelliforme CCNUN1]